MPKQEFVHLHLHSEYSCLDGACRFCSLFPKLKEYEMKSVALTDHGNLFGAIQFYKTAKAFQIHPIIGCELYVAPGSRFERKSEEKKSANHLVLLAKSYQGYLSLAKLSSIAYTEGFYYKPRIDMEALSQYSKDLVCLTSCIKGIVPELIIEGKHKKAEAALDQFVQIFGKENVFLELQDQGLAEQKTANKGMVKLSSKSGVRLVATNDCHYLNREDAEIHDILLCIQTGKTLSEQQRMRFHSNEFYLKSADEMGEIFKEIPQSLSATLEIAEMCFPEILFDQKLLPHFQPPEGVSQEGYLRRLVEEGLKKRYRNITEKIGNRAELELDVIRKTGFVSYFLIVWDFVRYAKENGVAVGPGRGSAAGSIVSYALGITDIDPLEHGLLFERFLNVERISMPDIDIDFDDLHRDRVIRYVREKYGTKNVAQIITFGTMKAKNAVRDVGRVMDIPLGIVNNIAKMIPDNTPLSQALKDVEDLRKEAEADPQIKKLLQNAQAIEGTIRHCSTHAAGVVIADCDLSDIIPIYKQTGAEEIATQYTMKEVEQLGLLKMDFLGLKNLTIIEETIRRVKETTGRNILWDEIPLDDQATYDLLASGNTFGVFQLESGGMRELVKRLIPRNFADITALLALYRPGPLQSGMVDDFVANKHGRKQIIYVHELLKPILEETYGVILYQEQVMQIAQVMAGYTLGQADILRRAMGKKDKETMQEQKSAFVENSVKRGIDRDVAEKIFDLIIYFAGYGFNKSHSAAYALITYRTAYLKAHYPVEYTAALLTSEIGNNEKLVYYLGVCKEMGITILPPDVNESFTTFTAVGDKIRFGLAGIKNVGEAAVNQIIEERIKNGPFKNFQDFVMRVPSGALNSRLLEALIKCGAFDSLRHYRSQLMAIMGDVLQMASHYQKEKSSGQASFFDLLGEKEGMDQTYQTIEAPHVPPWSDKEKLQYEKQFIGFYVTGHPLNSYRADIHSLSNVDTRILKQKKEKEEVCLVGLITAIQPKLDRNGNAYAHVVIEDFQGSVRLVLFSRSYEQYKNLLEMDHPVFVRGYISIGRSEPEVIVQEMARPSDARKKMAKAVEFEIPPEEATEKNLESILGICKKNKGKLKVRISLNKPGVGSFCLEAGKQILAAPSDELIKAAEELPFRNALFFPTKS
ncbi:DNA polymerase III subunit alpha [Candidatus Sumerlaeota bacterium]|nr:DNA polymerase III subunit alpha [Candidatus Sumerlaeota bacterium]